MRKQVLCYMCPEKPSFGTPEELPTGDLASKTRSLKRLETERFGLR